VVTRLGFCYHLDEFIEDMDKGNVISVRVGLTKPYTEVVFDTWLGWQFCYILLKYYDGEKLALDLSSGHEQLVKRLSDLPSQLITISLVPASPS